MGAWAISRDVHQKDGEGKNATVGEGSSGIIFLILDEKVQHAMKSVDLCSDSSCSFSPDEVRCWFHLNDSGNVPKLYMI
ncbi:hypothetical protein DPMN_150058 [Dreissena polymorpha]|uniref:Uncharacterized protein n=1 Tax=Dreissena polymorpha TaxID=45954 RepID=A0A9D4J302_DREPO|nr:hypothetical protein DPMN_150058 [Dreissena polymorpha]